MTYGPMAGRWRDTVLLEPRSSMVGGCGAEGSSARPDVMPDVLHGITA
jgi:hypothetical protein